jgi:hypothetical protein
MLGLWGLSAVGFLDISLIYMLPTFLAPMALGGLLFGIGMVVGGYCPGTAAAAIVNGKVDAMVFIVGFLIGALLFGDLFPVWGDFYNSDYLGVYRLDEWLGISLGSMTLIVVLIAVGGTLGMRAVQNYVWPSDEPDPQRAQVLRLQGGLIAVAILIGVIFAFLPNERFLGESPEDPWYIVPRTAAAEIPSETLASTRKETNGKEAGP